MPPLLAYFDTNSLGHMHERGAGLTDGVVRTIEESVVSGKLLIPASVIALEELLAAGGGAGKALALGQFYSRIVSLDRGVKPLMELLNDACRAYAKRLPEPEPYIAFGNHQRTRWTDLVTGRAATEDVERILGDLRKESEFFLSLMNGKGGEFRAAALIFKNRRGRMPSIQDIWDETKETLLEIIANHAGCLEECKARGLHGLLASRAVHATVGIRVSQAHAQSVEKKNPDLGDARDQQHIAMAAAVGGVFVTHDKALARTAKSIPGLVMEVLSVSELVQRLARTECAFGLPSNPTKP